MIGAGRWFSPGWGPCCRIVRGVGLSSDRMTVFGLVAILTRTVKRKPWAPLAPSGRTFSARKGIGKSAWRRIGVGKFARQNRTRTAVKRMNLSYGALTAKVRAVEIEQRPRRSCRRSGVPSPGCRWGETGCRGHAPRSGRGEMEKRDQHSPCAIFDNAVGVVSAAV